MKPKKHVRSPLEILVDNFCAHMQTRIGEKGIKDPFGHRPIISTLSLDDWDNPKWFTINHNSHIILHREKDFKLVTNGKLVKSLFNNDEYLRTQYCALSFTRRVVKLHDGIIQVVVTPKTYEDINVRFRPICFYYHPSLYVFDLAAKLYGVTFPNGKYYRTFLRPVLLRNRTTQAQLTGLGLFFENEYQSHFYFDKDSKYTASSLNTIYRTGERIYEQFMDLNRSNVKGIVKILRRDDSDFPKEYVISSDVNDKLLLFILTRFGNFSYKYVIDVEFENGTKGVKIFKYSKPLKLWTVSEKIGATK